MSDDYSYLMNSALRFLSVRSRSEKEINDYLAKKDKKEEITLRILERLKEMGYVDDKKFAQNWVASRTRSKAKGARVLVQELKGKGIADEHIQAVMGEFKQDQDEVALARQALGKRAENLQKLPGIACRRKMSDFLLRRGFSYPTIRILVDEYCSKAYNTPIETTEY